MQMPENWSSDSCQDTGTPAAIQPERRYSLPLAVVEIEFQANDRRSFDEFVSFGVMNAILDATTAAFFRERLRKADVIEALFERSEG
jgi:hypothetical protein